MSEAVQAGKTAWAWTVGTFLGAGRLRPGPGTWGSAAAALLWLGAAKGLHLAPAPMGWLTMAAALGALAIGNVKYQTESRLFKKMATSDKALCLDFRDAFKLARELV